MNANNGILYITSAGDAHYTECLASARQVKSVMPDLPIGIITDEQVSGKVFDEVVVRDVRGGFVDKPMFFDDSPFRKTVYLDTDTYVTTPIDDIFELLGSYPIAAAIAPNRATHELSLQGSYPEYNTGVLAYRNDESISEFFEIWVKEYDDLREQRGIDADQPSFRKATFETSIQVHTLPPEYNVRSRFAGYLQGRAKIIHGRHPDLADIDAKLNRRAGKMRVFVAEGEHDQGIVVYALDKKPVSLLLKNSIRKNGIVGTVHKGVRYLPRLLKEYV